MFLLQNTRQKDENVFVKSMNIAEFARLIISNFPLTFVCHISVLLIAMPCDDPMSFYAAKSTVIYVTSTVHIQCV